MSTQQGKIIMLNGASSSGKSTLARALQDAMPQPFWHYSIDHLIAAQVLPKARIDSGEFPWRDQREQFFDGFHQSLPAFAEAGNNLIVEHIVETQDWMDRLVSLLGHQDVFFVGIHCSLSELERREVERGDRRIGEAKQDFETTHNFCLYDFEVNSEEPLDPNVQAVLTAWQKRSKPNAFDRMAVSTGCRV